MEIGSTQSRVDNLESKSEDAEEVVSEIDGNSENEVENAIRNSFSKETVLIKNRKKSVIKYCSKGPS